MSTKTKYVVEVAIVTYKKFAKKEVKTWVEETLTEQASVEGWAENIRSLRVRKVDID